MSPPPTDPATLQTKARRKALGWNRAELAHRAGLDPRVVQLVELQQWEEPDALRRVAEVLDRAEAGELDVHLGAVQADQDSPVFGGGDGVPEA